MEQEISKVIYRIYDTAGRYRGYKTISGIIRLGVPFRVDKCTNYRHGTQVVRITAYFRAITEDNNNVRVADDLALRSPLILHTFSTKAS